MLHDGVVEYVDGGAHLVAARDRAVAAVVHAFGRGRIGDDDCARLLDEVQVASDLDTLERVVRQLQTAPSAGSGTLRPTRPLSLGDLAPADIATLPRAARAAGPTRALDAVDLALAARATERTHSRRADPRLVALVTMVVLLVVLSILGVVLVTAVRSDAPGRSGALRPPPGAAASSDV